MCPLPSSPRRHEENAKKTRGARVEEKNKQRRDDEDNEDGDDVVVDSQRDDESRIDDDGIFDEKNTKNDEMSDANLGPRLQKVEARLDSMLQGTVRLMGQLSKLQKSAVEQ